MSDILEAAISYGENGRPVFPCKPNKAPYTPNGFKDATTDPATIEKYWNQYPAANIGMPTEGLLVLDIDLPAGYESLDDLTTVYGDLPETLTQRTGGGGEQRFFSLPDGVVVKNSTSKLGKDLDIRGNGGYVIAPPSLHQSGNRYEWLNSNLMVQAPEWLIDLATQDKKQSAPVQQSLTCTATTVNLADEIRIVSSTPSGGRNDQLNKSAYKLGQLVATGELDQQDVGRGLLAAALVAGLSQDEATKTIKSGLSAGIREETKNTSNLLDLFSNTPPQNAQNTPSKPRFKLTPVSDLLKEPPPLEWLIHGYLLPQCNAQAYGESGAGKSLIIIDWSAHIAIGRNWHGHSVKQGGVIYLAGEGHHGISRRVTAWAKHNNAEAELAASPLVVSEKGAALNTATELAEVIEAIDHYTLIHGNPVLIVVDTLHRNMQGDENSATDMGAYFQAVDTLRLRYGSTVLTAHHTGHGDKTRSRGSSAIKAALDIEYSVSKKGKNLFALESTKMKDAPTPKSTTWEIRVVELPWRDSDGEVETSVVPVLSDDIPKDTKKMTPAVEHAVKTFFEAATVNGSEFFAHLDDWRPFYYESHTADNDEAKKKAFQRARNTLVKDGVLTVRKDVYILNFSGTFPYSDLAGLVTAEMLTKQATGTDVFALDEEGNTVPF